MLQLPKPALGFGQSLAALPAHIPPPHHHHHQPGPLMFGGSNLSLLANLNAGNPNAVNGWSMCPPLSRLPPCSPPVPCSCAPGEGLLEALEAARADREYLEGRVAQLMADAARLTRERNLARTDVEGLRSEVSGGGLEQRRWGGAATMAGCARGGII
jgi:hypothetical protein